MLRTSDECVASRYRRGHGTHLLADAPFGNVPAGCLLLSVAGLAGGRSDTGYAPTTALPSAAVSCALALSCLAAGYHLDADTTMLVVRCASLPPISCAHCTA